MEPSLKSYFDRLDVKLAALFEDLNKYSDDDLNWKPKADQWSVLQVMIHLMLAEKAGLNYMQKKLSSGADHIPKAGILSAFSQIFLVAALRVPIKAKAPAAVSGENLPERSSFWDIVKQWKKQREDLRAFLSTLPPEILVKQIYRDPFSGRSNAKGMLRFCDEHFHRHRKQINRILQNYRY